MALGMLIERGQALRASIPEIMKRIFREPLLHFALIGLPNAKNW